MRKLRYCFYLNYLVIFTVLYFLNLPHFLVTFLILFSIEKIPQQQNTQISGHKKTRLLVHECCVP